MFGSKANNTKISNTQKRAPRIVIMTTKNYQENYLVVAGTAIYKRIYSFCWHKYISFWITSIQNLCRTFSYKKYKHELRLKCCLIFLHFMTYGTNAVRLIAFLLCNSEPLNITLCKKLEFSKLILGTFIAEYQWRILAVCETGIRVWTPKLWRLKNTFQFFFFQLHFNKNLLNGNQWFQNASTDLDKYISQ